MDQYQNMNRLGVRTTTSVDPKLVIEDINESIRKLEPAYFPMQFLSSQFGRGKPPISKKVQVMQYHAFDNFDHCELTTLGSTVGAAYNRLALLTVDQKSRPLVAAQMYYQPQDKIWLADTEQVCEVFMTPDASVLINGTEFYANTTLTGNTLTRTAPGTILVRTIENVAFQTFSEQDFVFLGRTIYESQNIEAKGAIRDVIWDMNFVEHKEKVLQMTEEQKNMIQLRGIQPDWSFQQREMLLEHKTEVELNGFFSERGVDMDHATGRPMHHMRGLHNAIRTNISYYDPLTVTDFEDMFINFMHEQAFRYNPGGREKVALVGGRFLVDFNKSFKDLRRTSSLSEIGKKIGLNMESYYLGGNTLTLMRSEVYRQNTNLENWCVVIDPALAEWRLVKEYESRMYQLANERDTKLMVEWEGTIAWQLEQSMALLRT